MFLSALLVELIVLMIGKRLVVGNVNERILHLSQFRVSGEAESFNLSHDIYIYWSFNL